jgi:hypothetical protein
VIQHAKAQNILLLDTWSHGSIELRMSADELHILPAKNQPQVVLKPRE